jgi:hypothetical protein
MNRGGGWFDKRTAVSNTGSILQLSPKMWFRFNVGITVTGQGVSRWADQSGNGNDLLQTTNSQRPPLQADGSMIFDGITEFLATGVITLVQPETVYLLARSVTWVLSSTIWDGTTASTSSLFHSNTTPKVSIYSGAVADENSNWPVNTYAIVCVVYNGPNCLTQINNTAPVTGDSGSAGALNGFSLGGITGAAQFANLQAKEALVFPVAHDAATRARVIGYLAGIGGLSI